jgi:hypothetical protein
VKSEENLDMTGRKAMISHIAESVAVMKGGTTGIKGSFASLDSSKNH